MKKFWLFSCLVFMLFCGVVLGNDGRVVLSKALSDYKFQINTIKKVSFEYEKSTRRKGSESTPHLTKGTFETDGVRLRQQITTFDAKGEKEDLYESLFCSNERLITVFNDVKKERLSVISALEFSSLGDKMEFWNHLGPWGILWGGVRFAMLNERFSLSTVVPDSLNWCTNSNQNDDRIALTTRLEKENGNLELKFIRRNNTYCLNEMSFTRDKGQGNPQNHDYFSFVVEEYSESNGLFFPVKFTIEKKVPKGTFSVNGEEWVSPGYHSTDQYRLYNVKLNDEVDSDFSSLKTHIPNFTEVSMQDVPQIKYVWLDGKIVPYTDELALSRLRGHGFIVSVREPRFWLIAGGIILIVFSVGLKIKDLLKKHDKNEGY
jgi:hypothetical protein